MLEGVLLGAGHRLQSFSRHPTGVLLTNLVGAPVLRWKAFAFLGHAAAAVRDGACNISAQRSLLCVVDIGRRLVAVGLTDLVGSKNGPAPLCEINMFLRNLRGLLRTQGQVWCGSGVEGGGWVGG